MPIIRPTYANHARLVCDRNRIAGQRVRHWPTLLTVRTVIINIVLTDIRIGTACLGFRRAALPRRRERQTNHGVGGRQRPCDRLATERHDRVQAGRVNDVAHALERAVGELARRSHSLDAEHPVGRYAQEWALR